jgi:hypothetical protein
MKIYRSIYCNSEGLYPLKKVELIESEGQFTIYKYDVGFEPPYWDATLLPSFTPIKNFEDAIKKLKEQGISVSGWQIVSKPFFIVSNSIIRDEIRYNLNEDEDYQSELNSIIPYDVFQKSFNHFYQEDGRKYGGQTVYCQMIFQKNTLNQVGLFGSVADMFEEQSHLLSYESTGYFVPANQLSDTRNPELIGKDRLIIKGNSEQIAFSCVAGNGEEPLCSLYDQGSRTNLHQGKVVKIIINFVHMGETFIMSYNNFHDNTDVNELKWEVIDFD